MQAQPEAVTPILQVHPTRRCNLRCLHCYSSSGPDVSETLPFEVVASAIADAAALGYGAVSDGGHERLLVGGH